MEKPHVILIMCDQWNPFCTGYMGHPLVKTPHLDRLAREGTLFENAYCTSPVCSPARASWLTGLYPHAHRVQVNCGGKPRPFRTELGSDTPTLGDCFHEAGYQCGTAGPWHLGRDWEPQHGFTALWETFKYQEFQDEGRPDPLKAYFQSQGVENLYRRKKKDEFGNDMDHMVRGVVEDPRQQRTTWTFDRSISWIREQQAKPNPFFLFLSLKDPHPPIFVDRELLVHTGPGSFAWCLEEQAV